MSNAALAADRSEARTASDRPEPMNLNHGKKQNRSFGTIIAPYLFVLPAFVIVFVFIVLAALNTFRLAFTNSTLLRPGTFVGLENFIKLFHDEYFLTALLNSTLYVICVVPFMVILPLILAYLVKGNSRIMGFFRTAFYMPVVMSAVVVGMIWTNLLDSAGLVNSVLKALKIISKPVPFLTDRWGVLFSSMFVTIWLGLGYYMVIYLTALANIDESLYEAASLDGAGPVRQFIYVTMPGVRSTMMLIMMLSINPLMTLITVVILPVSVVLIMVVVKRPQKYFVAQQRTLGKINGIVEETFSGHAIVKAFNREDGTVDRFNETNAKLYGSAWKSQFFSGLMQPIMTFVGNLGYVAVAIAGSFLAVQGVITVGDIQAFIQYVKNFTQPITQLTQVSNVLQQMAAAAERIFEFLDAPEEEPDHATARTADVECNVQFDHVRFGYDPEKPVIKDFSAQVSEGQTVALVGPTGAGKTTMVKLLMRFYDVQSGCIKIGGTDIRDFARDDLRSLFGMVLQDTWLFHGTIRDNIRYGKLDATDEEVEAAAKAAYVNHFIQTLPQGYDTEINEDASNISQGQRQLLTIARAILADRRMLILDEATSSVDTRTEERIQKAMDNLMAGRTSFVIAHRLSTIKSADLILVIRDGDIVEQGTHEELLALGGFYAELYNSQFTETIDEVED